MRVKENINKLIAILNVVNRKLVFLYTSNKKPIKATLQKSGPDDVILRKILHWGWTLKRHTCTDAQLKHTSIQMSEPAPLS